MDFYRDHPFRSYEHLRLKNASFAFSARDLSIMVDDPFLGFSKLFSLPYDLLPSIIQLCL